MTAKRIARNRHAVLTRLRREADDRGDAYQYGAVGAAPVEVPTTVVIELNEFPDDAQTFGDLVGSTAPTLPPDALIEAWGVRAAPGAPTAGAVLAFRIEPVDP